MASPRNQLFLGTFIHCKDKQHLDHLHNTAVFVDGASGKIVAIEPSCSLAKAEGDLFSKLGWDRENVAVTETAKERQFFFPGFIGECTALSCLSAHLTSTLPTCPLTSLT